MVSASPSRRARETAAPEAQRDRPAARVAHAEAFEQDDVAGARGRDRSARASAVRPTSRRSATLRVGEARRARASERRGARNGGAPQPQRRRATIRRAQPSPTGERDARLRAPAARRRRPRRRTRPAPPRRRRRSTRRVGVGQRRDEKLERALLGHASAAAARPAPSSSRPSARARQLAGQRRLDHHERPAPGRQPPAAPPRRAPATASSRAGTRVGLAERQLDRAAERAQASGHSAPAASGSRCRAARRVDLRARQPRQLGERERPHALLARRLRHPCTSAMQPRREQRDGARVVEREQHRPRRRRRRRDRRPSRRGRRERARRPGAPAAASRRRTGETRRRRATRLAGVRGTSSSVAR